MTKKPEVIPGSCGVCTYFKRSGVVEGKCRFYNVRTYARSECLAEREEQAGAAPAEPSADVSQAQAPAVSQDVKKIRPAGGIEVETADGQELFFLDQEFLREAILAGRVAKGDKARVTVGSGGSPQEPPWPTVQEVAEADFKSHCLYEPVSAHMLRGLLIGIKYGFYGGASLVLGLAIIILATALAAGRVPRFDLSLSELFTLLMQFCQAATAFGLVGVSFGAPLGTLVGVTVGLIRRPSLRQAPDAAPEARRIYRRGITVAAVSLAFWTPVYLLWLNPKVLRWVSSEVFPVVVAILWPK